LDLFGALVIGARVLADLDLLGRSTQRHNRQPLSSMDP
jgi:hypothetical protein